MLSAPGSLLQDKALGRMLHDEVLSHRKEKKTFFFLDATKAVAATTAKRTSRCCLGALIAKHP